MAQTQVRNVSQPDQPFMAMRVTLSTRRLVLVMAGVMLGMLLSALDQTIVGTAMPRIIADLNGLEHYTWVVTAYMLGSTVMVPIYGKLSDNYGRRIFFIGGMVVFMAGSALSGLSQTMTQLIFFRGIQGFGAAAMMPIAIAIVGDVFTPAERAKWQGVMTAVFGLASIVGPLLGGWITDGWGWRWVFYVNLPIGLLALLVCSVALPRHSRHVEHKIDYVGAVVLIIATVPMLLAFTWAGSQYDWASVQIIGLLAFAAVTYVGFFFLETRAVEPIISPGLFKNEIFSVSILATFLVSIGMFGAIMYVPLFIQGVVGDTASNSGQLMTPMMLGFMASSIVGGQILARTGRYKIIAGVGFAIGAFGMFMLSRMDVHATGGLVIRNMIITGLGMGVTMSLFTIVVQNAFPLSRMGEVTSSLTFFRSLGSTIGLAVLGTVMTNSFHSAFQNGMPQSLKQVLPPAQVAALQNPQILLSSEAMTKLQQGFAAMGAQGEVLFHQLMDLTRSSLDTAITNVFFLGSVMLLLSALVTVLFLKEIPLRRSFGEAAHRAEAAPVGAPDESGASS